MGGYLVENNLLAAQIVSGLVFLLTMVLISAENLVIFPHGRNIGALFGGLLMIAIGVVTPEEAIHSAMHPVLIQLLAMMLWANYLLKYDLDKYLEKFILIKGRSPLWVLGTVSLLAGLLSVVLLNDISVIFLTPIVVNICARYNMPFRPFLLATCTAANILSAMSSIGNPQNIIIAEDTDHDFIDFVEWIGLSAFVSLGLNWGFLYVYYRVFYNDHYQTYLAECDMVGSELHTVGETTTEDKDKPVLLEKVADPIIVVEDVDPQDPYFNVKRLLMVSTMTVTVLLIQLQRFFLEEDLTEFFSIMGAFVMIMIDWRDPRKTLANLNWGLLLLFVGLFLAVKGIEEADLVTIAWGPVEQHLYPGGSLDLSGVAGCIVFTIIVMVVSNIISNIPIVMLIAPKLANLNQPDSWAILAWSSTVAGNLTLLGSAANLIVAEVAKAKFMVLDSMRAHKKHAEASGEVESRPLIDTAQKGPHIYAGETLDSRNLTYLSYLVFGWTTVPQSFLGSLIILGIQRLK